SNQRAEAASLDARTRENKSALGASSHMQLESAAAPLIVTCGSVAFAVAVALWAHRMTGNVRGLMARWRARVEELEWKVDRSDGIFSAHPGVIMVWEDEPASEAATRDPFPDFDAFDFSDFGDPVEERSAKSKRATDWGRPRLFGSPPALLAMLRLVEA